MAKYEDAERLDELVNSVLSGTENAASDEAEFRELIQRLVTENDEEVATRAQSLNLPRTLVQLAENTTTRRDNMLTSTGFSEGMRRIKEILKARTRSADRPADELQPAVDTIESSRWTGASTPQARLGAVRALIPVAQCAVEQIIESIERGRHNGGPPLDDQREALEALRGLHAALGELLSAADEGNLDGEYHGGAAAEAVEYANRALQSLRHDPLPYAAAATILGIMCACGFPTAGAFLADVAFNIRRPARLDF